MIWLNLNNKIFYLKFSKKIIKLGSEPKSGSGFMNLDISGFWPEPKQVRAKPSQI